MFLLSLTLFMAPLLVLVGAVIGYSLGLPPFIVFGVFLLSLFGSQINFKLKETESYPQPVITFREVNFFGISWRIPEIGYGARKPVIAINLGGAIIPILVSLYILLYAIPVLEQNPVFAYLKILAAFLVVTFVVHKFARPVKGLGIAISSFIPPVTAAITSVLLFSLGTQTNPFMIAYVAGTMGSLVGADLLNLNKISKLGSPLVSIGGAGVFDGVYMSGIMAIFLLWLML